MRTEKQIHKEIERLKGVLDHLGPPTEYGYGYRDVVESLIETLEWVLNEGE